MAFYIAGLMTLCAVVLWGTAGFAVFELPSRILEWCTGLPWGRDPWWSRLISLLTGPLLVVLFQLLMWAILVLRFGRPYAVLRTSGIKGRDTFWQRWFHRLCWEFGDKPMRTSYWVTSLATLGVGLVVLSYALTFLPRMAGWRDRVLPWTGRGEVVTAVIIVWLGLSLAIRQCRKVVSAAGEAETWDVHDIEAGDAQTPEGNIVPTVKGVVQGVQEVLQSATSAPVKTVNDREKEPAK
ncbi:MAG: hypothetical protein WCN95_07850 [bacterium]